MENKQIRTRFAPSPTGFLHLGSMRTALYNYLFAKKNGGVFYLRIEDTDQNRLVEKAKENMLETLEACGITPDETFENPGEFGPYIQSERLPLYKEYVDKMLAEGKAYYCFCTPERLDELRTLQQKNKQPTKYDRKCLHLTPEEVKAKIDAGEKYVIRFKIPDDREVIVDDLVRGEVRFNSNEIDDQVLMKSDGFPTYHLAHAVDDHLMQTTHVIRGEEWLPSTPKHLLLFEALGFEAPRYAHLALMLNPDKSKLSKRQGDVNVEDYLAKGYLPEAIVNFVALCGWHPSRSEKEIFSMEELINDFELANVQKAGAVCDLEKAKWFNREHLKTMDPERLRAMVLATLPTEWNADTDPLLDAKIKTMQERIYLVSEAPENLEFYYKFVPNIAILPHKKFCPEIADVKKALTDFQTFLETVPEEKWNETDLQEMGIAWIKDNDYKNGQILWPYRAALTGLEQSPNPFEVSGALGRAESLRRLAKILNQI